MCDRNNFIDLQKLLLEIKCKISRTNDGDLRTGTDATNTDAPYFSNKALHSFFSECTVSASGVKFSNTNGNYAHKAFIETAIKALVANSQENYFIGKPASDILTCDKHLLSGVTLRISFRRSTNDFAVISESNKHYKVKTIEANI